MVVIPYQFKGKDELRKWLWKYLSDYHLTMVPRPCFARVPSFKATHVATARLTARPEWQAADTVVIAPDDVTTEARREAIRQNKRLFVPLPKSERAVLLEKVDPGQATPASLMKEIGRFGREVPLAELKGAPLLITGAVSVDRFGNWLGQGEIFGELHPSLVRADGILAGAFRVAVVDDMQIFEDFEYLMDPADAKLDLAVTKTKAVAPEPRTGPPTAPHTGPILIR
ncbi:MAG: hypothetical protein HZA24_00800 [Nitrospirae bacterium]|nr:hypothetical protein [Nitrospirota bacterium]